MSDFTAARNLYAKGKLLEAEGTLEKLLESEPHNIQAKVLLGVIYAKGKKRSVAMELLESVLKEYPEQFDSLVWLATLKNELGAFEDSIALGRRAVHLRPGEPVAYNTLGLTYLASRQTEAAVEAFRQAIKLAPRLPQSHHNLGLALRLRDRSHEAMRAFQRAIELDPLNEGNYLQLYRQQLLISAWHDAILNMEEGLRRIPRSIAIQDALAMSYCRTNQKERGEAMFKSILSRQPGYCHYYSLWLQEEGRFKESIELLERWLEIEPKQGIAYFCLSEAKAFELSDGSSLSERAEALLNGQRLRPADQMYLAYTLGRACEHAKEYEAAIRHFDKANELAFLIYNEGRRLDFDAVQINNDCVIELFSTAFLAEHRGHGSSSEAPILIVGMIRSGTTLTDQIVSSHPDVLSAGEQPFWKLEGPRIMHDWQSGVFDLKEFRRLEASYLDVLTTVAGPSERITDKQPLNYELLGLIHVMFPKAKILHVRRSPLDTCLSIYSTHFGGGPNFAYKQENIVFHYREYMRLMEHWRKVLPPESLFEVDYEELVANQEQVTRQVVEFCGMPWNDACLRHHESMAAVSTPSRWQARQPVYSSSVEKWKKYEPWLGDLLKLEGLSHPSRLAVAPVA